MDLFSQKRNQEDCDLHGSPVPGWATVISKSYSHATNVVNTLYTLFGRILYYPLSSVMKLSMTQ